MTILAEARRARRRHRRSPFPVSAEERPLIVHCCHHKVGTFWFRNVLSAIADHYGLRVFSGEQSALRPPVDIFFQDHSRIDREALGDARGSHMIRDPRDVVVSAYFYHLRTDESWALRPRPEYGGRSYQQHLRSLDREAGIAAEIERSAPSVIRDMVAWDYEGNGFLELRYESLLADEEAGFRRLFGHYGFAPQAVERCLRIARRYGLRRMRRRSAHVRSGRPGEWRSHFSAEHKALFKRLTSDAALRLGYETQSSW